MDLVTNDLPQGSLDAFSTMDIFGTEIWDRATFSGWISLYNAVLSGNLSYQGNIRLLKLSHIKAS